MIQNTHDAAGTSKPFNATIKPIAPEDVDDVAGLLAQRNGVEIEYTRSKYGIGDGRFRGVLARIDGRAMGCCGIVPRELVLANGSLISCGWFAEWYVSPQARGSGLGSRLLNALSGHYAVILGHPVPAPAQSICLNNGYRALPFQSRMRILLRRFAFERRRTHYWSRAVWKWGTGSVMARIQTLRSKPTKVNDTAFQRPCFTHASEHGRWIASLPPARSHVRRSVETWQQGTLEIHYADDHFANGELRRRVLYTRGDGRFDAQRWKPFLFQSMRHGCVFIELFTTEPLLTTVWRTLGANVVNEPPVLIKTNVQMDAAEIHGWDRDNWTFV